MLKAVSSEAAQTMPMTRVLSARRISLPIVFALALSLAAPSAFAANKDMVQLQTQVQELQTAVARLQQSNDERMGVLKDLVQQSADSVNKMSVAVDALSQQMRTQHDATSAKLDQFSTQVQTLNDSLDEVKARLNNLEKALKSVQDQQQSIDAALQNLAPPASAPAAPDATGTATPPPDASSTLTPPVEPTPAASRKGNSPATIPPIYAAATPGPTASAPSKLAAPAASALYKTALGDYMAAHYPLASSEFAEVARTSPSDPLAGNSFYYLGEIDFRAGKYSTAIKDYDRVLEQFPNNVKVPVSHLHKAQALLETGKREAGITELRTLITRFPASSEAAQARSKLNGMGVPITPRRPVQ
jgi:TolA-binding protein